MFEKKDPKRVATSTLGEIWSPQVEVFSKGDTLVVRADLPGLRPDDVKIHVEGDTLVFEGERRSEREEGRDADGYYHSERTYGSFVRRIALPRGIDASTCDATCEDGVLEVTMKLPNEGKRTVAIRGNEAGPSGEVKPKMSETQPAPEAIPSIPVPPTQGPATANGPASHS